MTRVKSELLEAFREDHARLGKAFHELSSALRDGDLKAAQTAARHLDKEAGAHIAFEEQVFYPRLGDLLGEGEVARMLEEHCVGLEVVDRLCDPSFRGLLLEEDRLRLLGLSEHMERHIAECGELFEALGRIPQDQQKDLYDRLFHWRHETPRWRAYAVSAKERPSRARDRS